MREPAAKSLFGGTVEVTGRVVDTAHVEMRVLRDDGAGARPEELVLAREGLLVHA